MKVAGLWDCPVEEQYEAPPGYYDEPYMYPFDFDMAAPALFGAPAMGLQVALDGDSDFLLRRVVGAYNLSVAGPGGFVPGLQVYDAVGRKFFSQPIDPNQAWNADIALAPEKWYPASGQIWFDLALYNPSFRVSGPTPASGIFWGQMAFQGVRRFRGVLAKPTYTYKEKPFVYRAPQVTLNWNAYLWGGGLPLSPSAPQTFVVPVNDYDFELLGMALVDAATGAYPWALDPPFKMTLYNQVQKAVYRRPVLPCYIFANAWPGIMWSSFSPGIVYGAGSQIKFDIHSLLLAADLGPPAPVYDIMFFGVRRIPV